MPAQYEAIRDHLMQQGKSKKEAQRIAAATYNKRHPGHPMSGLKEHLKKHGKK